MHHDHDLFAPIAPAGRKRAIALAVLAHLALIGALTWGVHWKTSSDQPAVEAELWSAVPQQAAPRPAEPPPPPPAPAPAPSPAPTPAPPPPQQIQPEPSQADIALEQEKKRQQEEKKRQARLEQQKREQQEKERRAQEEQQKQARAAQQQKEKAEQEKAAKAAEQEKQRKLAEEKRKAEADAKRAEALRQEQLKRIAGLAGATGADTATGNAQKSSGPSGSYGGRVAAKVKPNIVYPDTLPGDPRAEVEVRAAPDGTIVGVRLTKPSGNTAWDDAVVRALYKTETLPRDVDGRVPSSLVIGFRPKD